MKASRAPALFPSGLLAGAGGGALALALVAPVEMLVGPGPAGIASEGGVRLLLLLALAYAVAGAALGAALGTLAGMLERREAGARREPRGPRRWAAVLLVPSIVLLGHWSLRVLEGMGGVPRARALVLAALAAATCGLLGRILVRGASRWRGAAVATLGPALVVVAGVLLVPVPRETSGRGAPLALPADPPAGAPAPKGPNVVLITLDTVRADHLALYGYARPTSPCLARLASEGTLYRNAIAPSTMTLATHGSMFTGLAASVHGAHWDAPPNVLGRPLARSFVTLAERLRDAGWRTAGIAANYGYFGPDFGLQQGFEAFDARRRVRPVDGIGRGLVASRIVPELEGLLPLASRELRCRRGAEIEEEAAALLGRLADERRPFFLFVDLMDAHDPYLPPEPWLSRFVEPSAARLSDAEYVKALPDVTSNARTVDAPTRALLEAHYDGAIAYLDQQVGGLVERLRALGLLDDTLLVVTSDHGEAFGEHGLVGHGVSVYEDQVHVPLIVRWPGERARAEVVDERVTLLDLLPTILGELGLAVPPELEGASLRSPAADRELVTESFPSFLSNSGRGVERAIYADGLKLIVTASGRQELDPAGGPGTMPAVPSDEVAGLERRLQAWVAAHPPLVPDEAAPLSDAARRDLGALGYGR